MSSIKISAGLCIFLLLYRFGGLGQHHLIYTMPCPPSTITLSPVFSLKVALPHPTTAGIPSSRATIAAWDKGAPTSVMTAAGAKRQNLPGPDIRPETF